MQKGSRNLRRLAIKLLTLPLFLLLLTPRSQAGQAQPELAAMRQIALGRWFPEPLRSSRNPSEAENQALLAALQKFSVREIRDDFSALTEFLASFPDGGWRESLLANLGAEYFRQGYYGRALAAWETVWNGRATAPPGAMYAMANAGGELVELYARLGRMDQIRALLPDFEPMAFSSANKEHLLAARDGLWTMENRPEIAFRCGPMALDRIRAFGNPTNAMHPLIFDSKSTTNGISLAELAKLSRNLTMNYQMAFRSPGADLILPSVVHWKVGHYAALVIERGALILAQDPTFWKDTWMSRRALDEEGSGYFLVPPGALPKGWRVLSEVEGQSVFGKGATKKSDPDATTPYDHQAQCKGGSRGLADWNAHLMLVSQRIVDTPVGYHPPLGPPVMFTVSFNQRQGRKFGPLLDWTHNWSGFLVLDPRNAFESVFMFIEGGWLTFNADLVNTNRYHGRYRNPGKLERISTNRYEWHFPDGAKRVYGATFTNQTGATVASLYLAEVVDAAGNAVTLGYDSSGRLATLTDAIGQVTRLDYGLPDPGLPDVPNCSPLNGCGVVGNSEYPWLLTRVTDPFGRFAQFRYGLRVKTETSCFRDSSGRLRCATSHRYVHDLTNIVDVAGLESQLVYSGDIADYRYLAQLKTPYGTTSFNWFGRNARNLILEVTHPDGDKERIEYSEDPRVKVPFAEVFATVPQNMATWNRYLYARNTYHWDKKAYAEGFAPYDETRLATNDYTKARIYHFTHENVVDAAAGILESFKAPLENRVWYNYPGQALATVPGTSDLPSKIGRVLDDGTTQLQQFERNSLGKVTRSIDPVGRTLTFTYATNDVDLLEVRQTRAGNNDLLVRATYDSRHLPLTITDAAGQTTRFAYNSRGQILNVTNAKNEIVSFSYDPKGFLMAVDGPLPGAQDRRDLTYDATGRVRTVTDPDGYQLTFDYDALDRLLKVSFPDGTWQQITYDRLKPGVVRDRLGRQTRYTYDSLRRVVSVEDALGRVTHFDWCNCGEAKSIIDPLGRATTWHHDIQGRVIAKEYADGSKVSFDYERTTSRLRQIRDEQNQLTQFSYYVDDRLEEKRYLNAVQPTPSVSFTYDPDYSRMRTMQDGNGTTAFSYHPVSTAGAGQLASIDGPWANDTITFSHDELGRVVRRAINNVAVRKTFDPAGRLTQLTNALGIFDLTWEAGSGRLSAMHYPNGQSAEYTYHPNIADQLLQRITHRLPNNTILSEFTHAFNAAGQITNWTQSRGGALEIWTPAYDGAGNLAGVSITQSGLPKHTLNYVYDRANNRTVEQEDGTTRDFSYNALNQLTTISNSGVPATAYRWDAAHRLVWLTSGAHQTEFSYDGFGRRTRIVEKESGVVTSDKRFLWCGLSLCEERDSSGATVLKRFFGRGLRAEAGSDLPAGSYFYTRDHLGSIREMTDGSGAVRSRYEYSPFGVRERSAGDLNSDFGFTGHYDHPPSGLKLALYRAYDPRLGRWLSRDPMSESGAENRYAYVENDPLNKTDPLGLVSVGFSFYRGIGGGLSVSFDPTTFAVSAGFEIGVGKGVGIDFDPAGKPFRSQEYGNPATRGEGKWFAEESQATLFGEAEFRAGPVRGSAGLQSVESKCDGSFDAPEAQAKFCLGPVCVDGDLNITGRMDPTASTKENLGREKGGGIEAKAGVKVAFPVWEP